MSDIIKGANFFIHPSVDQGAATRAEAQITRLVSKASAAAKSGNEKLLNDLAKQIAQKTGQKPPEVKVKVKLEVDDKGQIRKIEELSAGALDPLIQQYDKVNEKQKSSAGLVQQEIDKQKENLATLREKAKGLNKLSPAYKRNAQAQAAAVAKTKELIPVLNKVSSLSDMKSQLAQQQQKLNNMNRFTVGYNKQGQMIAVVNQKWLAQKALVQATGQQVTMAGFAAQGFGAKVASAGAMMQAAFGWIAAVVAGLTALAGAVGALTSRAKAVQGLRLTFDGLGQSVEAQNAILGSARSIALDYGVSLQKVEKAYKRLGPAILEQGGSLKDTEGAIKSIAARTTMLGLNAEQSGRYIEAFAQVMGKGKLQSEELNQQFSELDGGLRGQLKNWLAANKGITDFEQAMKDGAITSDIFLEAFEGINKEIREKFIVGIDKTNESINTLGQEGGMTLNQLQQQMSALTSIGLEKLGEALAPLGRELAKIYASFVKTFTYIVTELPFLMGFFKGLGAVIGVTLKLAINSILLGFQALAMALDKAVEGWVKIYNLIKMIPIIGDALSGVEWLLSKIGVGFDQVTDNATKLSDETKGAAANVALYGDEAEKAGQKQIQSAKEAQKAEEKRNKAALDGMKRELELAGRVKDDQIKDIEKARDAELAAIDDVINAIKSAAAASKRRYDQQIANVKRVAAAERAAVDRQITGLKSQISELTSSYDDKIASVQAGYASIRASIDSNHSAEMANIEKEKLALKGKQDVEMKRLDMGPAKEKYLREKARSLENQARNETNSLLKAQMEMEAEAALNEIRRHDMELRHMKEMEELEKKRIDQEQEAEKKKASAAASEAFRVRALEKEKKEAIEELEKKLEKLEQKKKQIDEDEKERIDEINERKRDSEEKTKDALDREKQKKDEINEATESAIDRINQKYENQKRFVEDVEYAMKKAKDQAGQFGSTLNTVNSTSLTTAVTKSDKVATNMERAATASSKIKFSSGSAPGSNTALAAGGPVTGGKTYTVNELGQEAFLSSSGKLSAIDVPAFGQWKAPGSGSVIPAHVLKNLKSSNQGSIRIPGNINPGNSIARAISTINNSTGDNFNNSVTIQSANPVQAANNIMVEMTRLRRRRFG